MAGTDLAQWLLQVVGATQQIALDVFTDERLVAGIVLACTLFALARIRALIAPFAKLIVVYAAVFVVVLATLYGPADVQNLTSLKHVRRSAKAAVLTSVVCFFLGLLTPKTARNKSI